MIDSYFSGQRNVFLWNVVLHRTFVGRWRAALTLAATLLVTALIARPAVADAPATQPAKYTTPQEFLQNTTNDAIVAMGFDQAESLWSYNADSARDVQTCKLITTGMIEQNKMELAARAKWGRDGETAVAHACSDNVASDAPNVTWTIKGDRAIGAFAFKDSSPLFLVNTDSGWKMDLPAYRALVGDGLDQALMAQNAVTDQLAKDIDHYSTAGDFVKHIAEVKAKAAGN